MAEYIDRDMAIQAVCDNPYNIAIKTAKTIKAINFIPAADVVEVRHGEWVKRNDGVCYWYECSACGDRPPKNDWGHEHHSDYCPNCGAKMDGKGEGE